MGSLGVIFEQPLYLASRRAFHLGNRKGLIWATLESYSGSIVVGQPKRLYLGIIGATFGQLGGYIWAAIQHGQPKKDLPFGQTTIALSALGMSWA